MADAAALTAHGVTDEGNTRFAASDVERRKLLVERIAASILGLVTCSLVLPLVGIMAVLIVKAMPVLSWAFLTQNPQKYMTAGGIWAPLVGTFYLVVLSLAVAAPIGILAGVYLNEYAGDNWGTRIVNMAVVNLAGVPSIVHALFGVGAFVLFAGMGRSVMAASCTLAIMTLPVIISSTREALAAVPQSFREACWNMGASRWQTIRTIVLPNAISGMQNYYLWGPGERRGDVMIAIAFDRDDLLPWFEQVEPAATVHCDYCMPDRRDQVIYICRGPKLPLNEFFQLTKCWTCDRPAFRRKGGGDRGA